MDQAIDTRALGAFIRERRIERELTIRQLADRSGVSESTLIRIEQGPDAANGAVGKPRPDRLARVVAALDLGEGDLAEVLRGDPDYIQAVMGRVPQARATLAERAVAAADYAASRRPPFLPPAGDQPDLVFLHPDGTVAMLQVKTYGSSDEGQRTARLDELARAGKAAGYIVTVPAI